MTNTDIIQNELATHEEVRSAGLQLLIALYAGKTHDTLNGLRYPIYHICQADFIFTGETAAREIATNRTSWLLSCLPCSSSVQCVEWKTLSCDTLRPTDWHLEGDHLTPVTTDLPIAPNEILHVVRCGCKTLCSTASCTCRRNGLHCMPACKCYGSDLKTVNIMNMTSLRLMLQRSCLMMTLTGLKKRLLSNDVLLLPYIWMHLD